MERELTHGEKAVGLTFNPSNDEAVQELKEIFARAFDIVEKSVSADDGTIETARKRKMRDAALSEIITDCNRVLSLGHAKSLVLNGNCQATHRGK